MNSIEVPLRPGDEERGIVRRRVPAQLIIDKLNEIKNDPKSWKAGGAGGQDQYAGMPPFLRSIDEIIILLGGKTTA